MSTDTCVVQSFRRYDDRSWDAKCIRSVEQWAASNSVDYKFYDDQLFDFVPDRLRRKFRNQILPITDIARVLVVRQLQNQYRTVMWIDSDVIVFDPNNFTIPTNRGLYVCDDCQIDTEGHNLHNSVIVACDCVDAIETFIELSLDQLKVAKSTDRFALGHPFLRKVKQTVNLQTITNVATLTNRLIKEIASESNSTIEQYGSKLKYRVAAANMCGSLRTLSGMCPDMYLKTIDILCETKGHIINKYIKPL